MVAPSCYGFSPFTPHQKNGKKKKKTKLTKNQNPLLVTFWAAF
jgi:hypothetical protein